MRRKLTRYDASAAKDSSSIDFIGGRCENVILDLTHIQPASWRSVGVGEFEIMVRSLDRARIGANDMPVNSTSLNKISGVMISD